MALVTARARRFHTAMLLMLLSCAIAAGCGGWQRGHDNFKRFMQADIGKSADNPLAYRNRYRELMISSKVLRSGNIEEGFLGARNCNVFFEIDAVRKAIVGWRFEGAEEDCVIPF